MSWRNTGAERSDKRERRPTKRERSQRERLRRVSVSERSPSTKKRQTGEPKTRAIAEFETGGTPLPARLQALMPPLMPGTPPGKPPRSPKTRKALIDESKEQQTTIDVQRRAIRSQSRALEIQRAPRAPRTDPRSRGIRPVKPKWGITGYRNENRQIAASGFHPDEAYNPTTTHALLLHDQIRSGQVRNPAAQQIYAGMAPLETEAGTIRTEPGPAPVTRVEHVPLSQSGKVDDQRTAEFVQIMAQKKQKDLHAEFRRATENLPDVAALLPQVPGGGYQPPPLAASTGGLPVASAVTPAASVLATLQAPAPAPTAPTPTPTQPAPTQPAPTQPLWQKGGYKDDAEYRAHMNQQIARAKRRHLIKKVNIVEAHRDIQKDLKRLAAEPVKSEFQTPEKPIKTKKESPGTSTDRTMGSDDPSVQEMTSNVPLPAGGIFQGGDYKAMPALDPPDLDPPDLSEEMASAMEQVSPPRAPAPRAPAARGSWMTQEMRALYQKITDAYNRRWEEEKGQDYAEKQREKQMRMDDRIKMAGLVLHAQQEDARRWWDREEKRLARQEEEDAALKHQRDQDRIDRGKGITNRRGTTSPSSSDVDLRRRKKRYQSISSLEADLAGIDLGDVDKDGTRGVTLSTISGRDRPPHEIGSRDYGDEKDTIQQNLSQEMAPTYDRAAAQMHETMKWHKGDGGKSPTRRKKKFKRTRPGGGLVLRGGVLSPRVYNPSSPRRRLGMGRGPSNPRAFRGVPAPAAPARADLASSFRDLHRALMRSAPQQQAQQVLPAQTGQPVVITGTGAAAAAFPGVVVKQSVKQEMGTKKARKKRVRFAKKESLTAKKKEYGRLKKRLKKRLMQRKKELYTVEAKRIKSLPVKERAKARKDVKARLKKDFDSKVNQLPVVGKRKYNEIVALINKTNKLKW